MQVKITKFLRKYPDNFNILCKCQHPDTNYRDNRTPEIQKEHPAPYGQDAPKRGLLVSIQQVPRVLGEAP